MKRFIITLLVGVLCFGGVAWAGDITDTGMNQGDLVTYLENTATIVNELKDDVDALKLTIIELLEQIDADNGTIGTDYNSTLGRGGNATTSNIVPAPVSASDLSLTGL